MRRADRYTRIIEWFRSNMPSAETELHYNNPYHLLVAVILSAQCTDKRVNMTTPALLDRFPTPQSMADAEAEDILPYIKSISYPNNKAKNLAGMAKKLVADFNGEVPDDIDLLQTLPGVGRKTANVIGSVIFGKKVMAVETHVFRVSARLGLTVNAKNPLQTEKQLSENIPSDLLPLAHHWLILHGRYVCTARKPKSGECGIKEWCKYYADQEKAAAK
ncbi:MAG: endonuclease III [Rikenellaceae bacterium]|nr:endonuclease III [Rikenellaceae bacterium]